uniref:Plasmid mobilization protein n=1 Tax=Enterobacter sp. (strain 638) TaxID=399742 RepID=I3RZ50_ENT38|nr:plasmid mobilization protein [Enterobacter sp. 638]
MKSQFLHVELYSKEEPAAKTKNKNLRNHKSDVRHTTVSGVLSEMKREDGYTSHIDEIHEPNVLYGSVSALERSIERYEAEHKTKDKNGKEKKLRKDACILLAGVISLDRGDEEIWDDYKNKAIEYLKNKYGDDLRCIVEHTDETNPHFHFYVVSEPGKDLNLLHDGKKAVSKLDPEQKKKNHLAVYTKAMVEFQDDFYIKVSNKFGLTRTGEEPRERYSSRQDYLRFKKRQKEKLDILANIEKYEKKIEKKATTRGFNKGIKQFDAKTWLGKLDWRLKRRMLPLENKINILSLEKETIDKELKEKNNTINEISLQRNNASIQNMSYINDINRLKAENKDLLPYKMNFDKIFERAKRPFIEENDLLKDQNKTLNAENRDLRAKDNEFSEFVDTVKAYYGENYDDWYKEVFKKSKITPKF